MALALLLDAELSPIPCGADVVLGTLGVLTDKALGRVASASCGAVVGGDGLACLERARSIWINHLHLQDFLSPMREEIPKGEKKQEVEMVEMV